MKRLQKWIAICVSVALLMAGIPTVFVSATQTIVALSAENVTVTECADGSWYGIGGDEWFLYTFDPICTATLSDGTTVTGTAQEIMMATRQWSLGLKDDQSADTPWGVGEHTAMVACGEVVGEFTVTVVETPVASITAEAMEVCEYHADGYYDGHTDPETGTYVRESWFHYSPPQLLMTVTYKDGTVFTGTSDELRAATRYPVGYRMKQAFGKEYVVGENAASAVFMGVTTDFTVTVVRRIDRVEWAKLPDKQAYLYGEHRDLTGGELRIWYTDGTYEDAAIDAGFYGGTVTVDRLGKSYELDNLSSTFVFDSTISCTFLDWELKYDVALSPCPETLTLIVNEDRSLSFKMDEELLHIRSFTATRHGYGTTETIGGNVYTDRGVMNATFEITANGTMTMSLGWKYGDGGVYAVSNSVTDSGWVRASDAAAEKAWTLYAYRGQVDRFDGEVTAQTLDDLFVLAIYLYTSLPEEVGGYSSFYELPSAYAALVMKDAYGVEADMTTSRFYHAEDDTLYVPKNLYGDGAYFAEVAPMYCEGVWCVNTYTDTNEVLSFAMTEDERVTRFDVRTVGDVTGDGALSTADARQMLVGIVGGAVLSEAQQAAADVDQNGAVNTVDVRKLLRKALV